MCHFVPLAEAENPLQTASRSLMWRRYKTQASHPYSASVWAPINLPVRDWWLGNEHPIHSFRKENAVFCLFVPFLDWVRIRCSWWLASACIINSHQINFCNLDRPHPRCFCAAGIGYNNLCLLENDLSYPQVSATNNVTVARRQ